MRSKKREKIDWGLKFYRDVLKLDDLHFGLWENDPLTVEGAKQSQKRYTEQLIELIPDGVESILDVGCGTGTTAVKLRNKGYYVECINPDIWQEKIFKERIGDKITFHNIKFESFETNRKFDLILMSESSQYMDTEKMIKNVRNILMRGGWLLIADYFRKKNVPYYKTCRIKDVFLKIITDNGFELNKNIDITPYVVMNLTLGKKIYYEYGLTTLSLITEYLKRAQPLLTYLGSKVFSKKLKKISNYIFVHTPEKLDEEKFIENMEYRFLLFKKR